ncbi:MAG: redox-regulated ATPase YchF [Desulfurococcales archaeon]|nr:redox-regulated ATPase YchF [Desulfurococcales archaeon]
MSPPEKLIGIIGKTNVGKSTLFAALTLASVPIANHPFTTIKPNIGIGYVKKKCVHVELGTRCNPRTGYCIKGYRFIPVKIIDVAGLIPGASKGRGLGNKFMDDLRQADVLIHVVDAAGSTSPEGNPVAPGTYDPVEEAILIQKEVDEWFVSVINRVWERFIKKLYTTKNPLDLLAQTLSGLSIKKNHVVEAIRKCGLEDKKFNAWSSEDIRKFAIQLRHVAKPIIIAANKIDLSPAEHNIDRLIDVFGKEKVVPVSALAELALKKAALSNLIEYIPGEPSFKISDYTKLTASQKRGLKYIENKVLAKWGTTGVQELLNRAVFNILNLIVVYPVEDHHRYTDHHGNVLPDAYLVPKGTTARELAYMIHTDLGRTFLYAINARTGERLGENYELQDNDIVKIVAVAAH